MEEALGEEAQPFLILHQEEGPEELGLALKGLFLVLQEQVDLVSHTSHCYTLQFCLGLADVMHGPRQPDQIDGEKHTETYPPEQPAQPPLD